MADARDRSTGKCTVLGKESAAAVCERGAAVVSIGWFTVSVVFDMCR